MMWRFWLGVFALLISGLGFASVMEQTKGQWEFATDVQTYYRCLPFEWYFVRNEVNNEPERGELVRFEAPEHVEAFDGTYELIKLVGAVTGDQWRIDNDVLYINNKRWGDLHLLESIGMNPGELDGHGVVPEGHIYVLGTNPSSLDSRYWGALDVNRINGTAYAIY